MSNTDPSGSILEYWNTTIAAIAQLDEQIDAQDTSGSAGKRAMVNSFVNEFKPKWETPVTRVVDQIATLDFPEQVAFVTALQRSLNSKFGKVIDEGVQKLVDSQPAVEQTMSDADIAKLYEDRSELRNKAKMLRDVLTAFVGGEPEEGEEDPYELPPVRRQGAKGTRGKRAISWYTWTVGDKGYETLAEVAKDYTTHYENSYKLRDAMTAAGLDLKKPVADTLEFVLPDGNKLVGTRDPNAPSPEVVNAEQDQGDSDEDDSPEAE